LLPPDLVARTVQVWAEELESVVPEIVHVPETTAKLIDPDPLPPVADNAAVLPKTMRRPEKTNGSWLAFSTVKVICVVTMFVRDVSVGVKVAVITVDPTPTMVAVVVSFVERVATPRFDEVYVNVPDALVAGAVKLAVA
jgi:hypothetical protein